MSIRMPDFEALLTTDEALARLEITPRRMYRLIRSGELPAVRIGRQWRFRPGDIENWMESHRDGFQDLVPSTDARAPVSARIHR